MGVVGREQKDSILQLIKKKIWEDMKSEVSNLDSVKGTLKILAQNWDTVPKTSNEMYNVV